MIIASHAFAQDPGTRTQDPQSTATLASASPARVLSYPELLALVPDRARRASSADDRRPDGNLDMRLVPKSGTITLAELQGPGVIRHFWMTMAVLEPHYARNCVVRIYWDGEEKPSVECPVGDFFGIGHGIQKNLDAPPIVVNSFGKGYNCYWPLPFRKSARITVSEDAGVSDHAIFWNIDWGTLEKLPDGAPYFHARYRQGHPESDGIVDILDTKGAGFYIGTLLNVRIRKEGWWGEGDEEIWIDGEATPSIRGTGTEDYFNHAWGLVEGQGSYIGAPVVEGFKEPDRVTLYRWHTADPVPFRSAFRMTLEHKNWEGKENPPTPRRDDVSLVAYWYQTGQESDQGPFPAKRTYDTTVIEFEKLLKAAKAAKGRVEETGISRYSSIAALLFTPEADDAALEIPFSVPADDRYHFHFELPVGPELGVYDVFLDDKPLWTLLDCYADKFEPWPRTLRPGWFDLKAGEHRLRFVLRGKHPQAKSGKLILDMMELTSGKSLEK